MFSPIVSLLLWWTKELLLRMSETVVQRCYIRKLFKKNFATVRRNHLCWSLFFNKVASWRPAISFKRMFSLKFYVNFRFVNLLLGFAFQLFFRVNSSPPSNQNPKSIKSFFENKILEGLKHGFTHIDILIYREQVSCCVLLKLQKQPELLCKKGCS